MVLRAVSSFLYRRSLNTTYLKAMEHELRQELKSLRASIKDCADKIGEIKSQVIVYTSLEDLAETLMCMEKRFLQHVKVLKLMTPVG